jgi:ADP-dependent NAD(P)H-hydrate dehydratase
VAKSTRAEAIDVSRQLLRDWPLPMPQAGGGKEKRGRVLIIGGCTEMPGAVILAATAALRAGAGKLIVATGASIAGLVAQALPEARVIGLRETEQCGLMAEEVERLPTRVDSVLIGPGMQDQAAAVSFTQAALQHFGDAQIVLDATAMSVVMDNGEQRSTSRRRYRDRPDRVANHFRFQSPVLLTPHAGEMAHLTGATREAIEASPDSTALDRAAAWNAVVALKGAHTFIATPTTKLWRHTGGNVGLAVSGSGDTLAGIIAGLAARGASLEQACVWGVALHALAGDALKMRVGPLGYLARELAGEVPALMRDIAAG